MKPLSRAICIGLGKAFIKLPCGHKDSSMIKTAIRQVVHTLPPVLFVCLLLTTHHIGQESAVCSSERFSIYGLWPTSSGDRSVVTAATCSGQVCRQLQENGKFSESSSNGNWHQWQVEKDWNFLTFYRKLSVRRQSGESYYCNLSIKNLQFQFGSLELITESLVMIASIFDRSQMDF